MKQILKMATMVVAVALLGACSSDSDYDEMLKGNVFPGTLWKANRYTYYSDDKDMDFYEYLEFTSDTRYSRYCMNSQGEVRDKTAAEYSYMDTGSERYAFCYDSDGDYYNTYVISSTSKR